MTSVLNVDTIADKAGTGPVALTKQSAATTRHTYDQPASTTVDSLNISSGTDVSTGIVLSTFNNSYSSATQRQVMVSAWNNDNGGANSVAASTRGLNAYQTNTDNAVGALKTQVTYGSTASSDGNFADVDGHYVVSFGDLA